MTAPEPRRNCPACGYAVSGLPSLVCPECGGTFDPFETRPTLRSRLADLAWPLCGVGLICFQFCLYIAGMLVGAGEPYADIGECVASMLVGAAFLGGLFFIPFGCIFAAVWFHWTPSPARASAGKTLAIYAASTLPPVAICSSARAFVNMRQAGFDLIGGKPPWINIGIIDVCDNPVTMILLCAAAIVLSSRIMRLKKP